LIKVSIGTVNNYKLTIQYDGTEYSGWQIQDNSNSVQAAISDAINILADDNINLIGSGRTDSGVHALGQVANFKSDKLLNSRKFLHSINSILPYDISIINFEVVDENFHSRFDAKVRSYVYVISKIKSPFYFKYSLFRKELNINLLNEIAIEFSGKHDYTSFCKKNTDVKNKICNIGSAKWKEYKNFYLFFISADRFLHGMVRTIVGTMIKLEKNPDAKDIIKSIFNAKDREAAGESAAAKGLFLHKVKY